MTLYARPEKHSLTLSGHRTSVTMEPSFWRAFQNLARAEGVSVNALAARIDAARPLDVGLASAIRAHVLAAALRDPGSVTADEPDPGDG